MDDNPRVHSDPPGVMPAEYVDTPANLGEVALEPAAAPQRDARLRLLAVLAHPDDEGAIGGTLAHYSRLGAEVMLICATRGEAGEISDPALATPETLGEVRTQELEAACALLGVHQLHFLGYRDSGMAGTSANHHPDALAQADPEEATARLVALYRRLRPDIVITFEPHGWYGHPDHIATGRFATAAYFRAQEPAAQSAAGNGQPWRPRRLYHAVIPVSLFETLEQYARKHGIEWGGSDDGIPIEDLRASEAQVTHIVDRLDEYDTKQAAQKAHRTQFSEDGLFEKMPAELVRRLWGHEHYIQVDPPPDPRLRQAPATTLWDEGDASSPSA
jgi:LmbE family N-acetylglucosaminyl deacetylase